MFSGGKDILFSSQKKARALNDPVKSLELKVQLVVRMLSWGASRATLPMFIGGDEALVRGVRADRGLVARPNT